VVLDSVNNNVSLFYTFYTVMFEMS
jgi:hypothetical protein